MGASLHCDAQASRCYGFSHCRAQAVSVGTSVVTECGLSSYDEWDLLLQGMWDLPGSGIEPVSSALAGKFLSIAPPGKSQAVNLRFGGVVREKHAFCSTRNQLIRKNIRLEPIAKSRANKWSKSRS